MLLEGKNTLVTESSQGIEAIASLEIARKDANKCFTDRKQGAEAKKYAEEICEMDRKAFAIKCDISSLKAPTIDPL